MALLVKKGTFTLPTVTQSVVVTGVGFQPKAIILWTSGMTATGFAATSRMGIGFGASSSQRAAVSIRGQDAGTSTGRNPTATRVLLPSITVAGVIEMQLDLTSLDTDGFTLAQTVNSAGTAYVVHYIALGGSDLTNAFVGGAAPSAGTGNKAITGVGFQPDLVLFITANDPQAGGSDTGASIGIGAATATQEGSTHFRSRNAANPTQDTNYQRSDKALVTYQTGSDAIDSEATLATMDSDGFTLNYTTHADATVGFSFLALKGGRYDVHAETQKTSTGTKAKTGVGFSPVGLLAFGANAVANASPILTQAKLTIGGTDGTTEGAGWTASTDNVATADRNSHHSTTKFMTHASNTATVNAECDSALDADGYTLDWTTADATAREMIVVAFGSAASTLTIGRRAAATTVRGMTLSATGNATLTIGRKAAATTVRGMTVSGSGTVTLTIGRRAAATTARGMTLTATGAAPLTIGRRASSTVARGMTLTATGNATLTIGRRAAGTTVRGATLTGSGTVTLTIGRRAAATTARGMTLSGTGNATLPVGRRATSTTVRGVVITSDETTLTIGRRASATTARGMTLSATGTVTIPIGARASSTTVRGMTLTPSGSVTIAVGRRASSTTVNGVTLTPSGAATITIGRRASSTVTRGMTLSPTGSVTITIGRRPSSTTTRGVTLTATGSVTLPIGARASETNVFGVVVQATNYRMRIGARTTATLSLDAGADATTLRARTTTAMQLTSRRI